MTNTTLDLASDIIDVCDIIARVKEIEHELESRDDAHGMCIDAELIAERQSLIDILAGSGGDEQWRGDWYPVKLIRDSHFTDYAREFLENCGDIPRDLPHYIEIDWDATARNIRVDYASVEIEGATYWFR